MYTSTSIAFEGKSVQKQKNNSRSTIAHRRAARLCTNHIILITAQRNTVFAKSTKTFRIVEGGCNNAMSECRHRPADFSLDGVPLGHDHGSPRRLLRESARPDDGGRDTAFAYNVFAHQLVRQEIRQHVVHTHLQGAHTVERSLQLTRTLHEGVRVYSSQRDHGRRTTRIDRASYRAFKATPWEHPQTVVE